MYGLCPEDIKVMYLSAFSICMLPLGVWKFIEIVIWLCTHVKISW